MNRYSITTIYFFICVFWSVLVGQSFVFLPQMSIIKLNFLYQAIAIGVPIIIYIAISKENLNEIFSFKKISLKNLLFIFVITVLSRPIAGFISYISSLFFYNYIDDLFFDLKEYSKFQILFLVAITPAFFEELFMRGVIFHGYKNLSAVKISVINGVLFGVFHLNFQQFFYAFFVGTLFSIFVYYTGSIFASMFSHFIFNSMSAYVFFVGNNEDVTKEAALASDKDILISLSLFSLICLVGLIFVMKKFIKYNTKKESCFSE